MVAQVTSLKHSTFDIQLSTHPHSLHIPFKTKFVSVIEKPAGKSIAGQKADRYDIVIMGKSFYKSAGPDLAAVKFTCLLSRALDVKAVQLK